MTKITSPVDLWAILCSSAGLELRLKGGLPGRDADIEEALKLALSVPSTYQSLADWLVFDAGSPNPKVSTERLLVEILNSQYGFAKMMRDILELLVTAQGKNASHELSIEFKFDDVSESIKATLEQFRGFVDRIQVVFERGPELPGSNHMALILRELRDFAPRSPVEIPVGFPSIIGVRATGHKDIDLQLNLINRLVSDLIKIWKDYGSTRQQVSGSSRAQKDNRDIVFTLKQNWDVEILSRVELISDEVISGRIKPEVVVERLTKALSYVKWTEVRVEKIFQELLDVLNMPAWKRRHELYSVWVGTRMLRVIEKFAPCVYFHAVNGVLSFDFGGSRLATFYSDGRQFDVWAEFRSALVGKSFKRKKSIQPDFRVMLADLSQSDNEKTTYVLECKHYLNASFSNFTQAAIDYARSCPNARVHVVNHGRVDEPTLISALPSELQSNTRFIGSATPLQEAENGILSDVIQSALFPGLSTPVLSDLAAELASGNMEPSSQSVRCGCCGRLAQDCLLC